MKTSIDIDDRLLRDAMAVTKLKTKKDAVHRALSELVRSHRQKSLLALRGRVRWEGDLDRMRETR